MTEKPESVKEYIDFPEIPTESYEKTAMMLPLGWLRLVAEMFWFWTAYRNPGTNKKVQIAKGLLRFSAEYSDAVDQKLFNRVAQSIASSSATVCMMCGKHGFRRKNEVGWPCLCTTHYTEYATQLSESESNV